LPSASINVDLPTPGAPEIVRHEFLEQSASLGAMIAARRLDQRNRAREGTPVTIEYSLS
jgi:hypothetical protein